MATTPRKLFDHAEAMTPSGDVECRTTISRGYYAAYHAAHEYHDELDTGGCLPEKKVGVHTTLFHQLKNPTVADPDKKFTSRKIGIMGFDLKKIREDADYYLDLDICSEQVRYVIESSKRLLLVAEKY